MTIKSFLTHLPTLVLTLAMAGSPHAFALNILIDPGHGGNDRGATRGQIKESYLALSVAKKLESLLARDSRFQVSLTRNTDRFVGLESRAQLSEALKADLFLSIHVNASVDSRAQGAEFYFQNQLPPDEESLFLASLEAEGHGEHQNLRGQPHDELPRGVDLKSLKGDVANIIRDMHRTSRIFQSSQLAEMLMNNWQGSKKSQRHVIRQAPFYVVSHVNVPSALVELGFLTHKKESDRLTDPNYQTQLASSIYDGLVKFKEFIDK